MVAVLTQTLKDNPIFQAFAKVTEALNRLERRNRALERYAHSSAAAIRKLHEVVFKNTSGLKLKKVKPDSRFGDAVLNKIERKMSVLYDENQFAPGDHAEIATMIDMYNNRNYYSSYHKFLVDELGDDQAVDSFQFYDKDIPGLLDLFIANQDSKFELGDQDVQKCLKCIYTVFTEEKVLQDFKASALSDPGVKDLARELDKYFSSGEVPDDESSSVLFSKLKSKGFNDCAIELVLLTYASAQKVAREKGADIKGADIKGELRSRFMKLNDLKNKYPPKIISADYEKNAKAGADLVFEFLISEDGGNNLTHYKREENPKLHRMIIDSPISIVQKMMEDMMGPYNPASLGEHKDIMAVTDVDDDVESAPRDYEKALARLIQGVLTLYTHEKVSAQKAEKLVDWLYDENTLQRNERNLISERIETASSNSNKQQSTSIGTALTEIFRSPTSPKFSGDFEKAVALCLSEAFQSKNNSITGFDFNHVRKIEDLKSNTNYSLNN